MSQKSIILTVIIFALIVAGMFIYAAVKKAEINQAPIESTEQEAENGPYAGITYIDAKHYFIDGKHTLVGEINLPTPCDLLDVKASVMESFPEQISVDFTVINNAEVCAQVITAQRFKVEAVASEEATFSAKLMNKNVKLNLIPAAEGEIPEEFEVFIKG